MHGTVSEYQRGCRCEACKAAERVCNRASRRRINGDPDKAKELIGDRVMPGDVCTIDELLLPMMGKPSIKGERCAVCGRPATNQHHVVRRGAGKWVRGGVEVRKPTVALCGSGNASGCHGLAHQGRLHFRWKATLDKQSGMVGGHWEAKLVNVPCSYQEALASEVGWERIPLKGADRPLFEPRKRKRRQEVLVDGSLYPTVLAAANAIGGSLAGLSEACRDGRPYKGHDVRYVD